MEIQKIYQILVHVSLGAGVAFAALKYGSQKIFENHLAKKLADHQKDLDKELEEHRSRFEKLHTEFQIKFSNLHTERLEAIKSVYSTLISINTANKKQIGVLSKLESLNADDIRSLGVFRESIMGRAFRNESYLYFNKPMADKLVFAEESLIGIQDICKGFHQLLEDHQDEFNNPSDKLGSSIREELPRYIEKVTQFQLTLIEPLIDEIETEFRGIIGVEPK